MTASIEISPEADLPAIAAEAGNGAVEARWYAEGRLYVEGVTQEALEAAAASVGTGPAAPPVPASITARQMELALLQAGLLDQVEALIAQADRAIQIEWQRGSDVYRDSPVLNDLAQHLQPLLSSAQIDDLFRAAAAL